MLDSFLDILGYEFIKMEVSLIDKSLLIIMCFNCVRKKKEKDNYYVLLMCVGLKII